MEPLNIFHVEDNEADIMITHEILDMAGIINYHSTVNTAEEAISYLNKRAPFEHASKPDIILLDINLPKSSGFAVLVEVRSTKALSEIPVVILTSSVCDYDKEFAYKNGADLYMEKPLDIKELKRFLEQHKINVATLKKAS